MAHNENLNLAVRATILLTRLRERPSGVAINVLADDLGVPARQVRRDLHLLRELGHDVELAAQLREDHPKEMVSFEEMHDILEVFKQDAAVGRVLAVVGVMRRMRDTLVAIGDALSKGKATPAIEDGFADAG